MPDMQKKNCWEIMHCGREIGGRSIAEFGACPAATAEQVDGVNQGKNAGRSCWAVSGTFCPGIIEGRFAYQAETCTECDFYKRVRQEEGASFQQAPT